VDSDGDGWTPAQGDCNDCDPKVNPGAVDVTGDPGQVDHDCNSKYDPPVPCDSVLALDDVSGIDGAKAIDLCQFTTASAKNWGVISSQYVRADGAAFPSPGAQVGLQPGFGPNVHPQGGQTMLALSSGYARTPSQAGNCGSSSCNDNATATPPPGFPQAIGGCAGDTQISDDVALQIDVRTPTNATGYAFSSKFYTMEFPYWLCNGFNDEFVVLASPAPAGAINGNLVFDAMQNPVSAVFSFLTACDPTQSAQYAGACIASFGSCPSPPNPYCPSGMAELQGTGFDVWDTSSGNAGATVWVKTQAPVQGGSEVTLRFTVWDGGDQAFDSTVLIDNFQWITSGAVSLGTAVLANPK
jgi:hypothetical protein